MVPAAKTWLTGAQARFPSRSVGKSLQLRIRGTRASVVSNDPRVQFFEEGVEAHVIEPKDGTVLRLADGRFVTGPVQHPGMRAQPTLKPLLPVWPATYRRAAAAVMRGRLGIK